jgi:hypothetical protein
VCGLALACGAGAVERTAPDTAGTSIADLMSPEELEASGVRSLTSAQRDVLDAWLRVYVAKAVAASQGLEQTIESRIDGDFDGWEGGTTFTLVNGQIWKQIRPGAAYYFALNPKVIVSGGSYRLRINGMAAAVPVRRIK